MSDSIANLGGLFGGGGGLGGTYGGGSGGPLSMIFNALGGGGGGLFGGGQSPSWMKYLLSGLLGMQGIGNFLAGRQQSGEFNFLRNYQNMLANLSPTALANRVQAATAPLSAGLTQEVGNQVQAMMAERGLAQAPGIFAATQAQALAPYYQQNQQTAEQLVMQQLLAPLQAAGPLSGFGAQQSSMMPLLLMLMSQFKQRPMVPQQQGPQQPGLPYPGPEDPWAVGNLPLGPGTPPILGTPSSGGGSTDWGNF